MKRFILALLLPIALTAACSDDTVEVAGPAGAATVDDADGPDGAVPSDRVVIDVRTPDEFAAGHVDGALLIDISAPDFQARIADLDPSGSYLVYCRSGNRSAQAVATMRDAGLDVEDGGGLGDMEAAGWSFTR
jgi:rhodanese-related sulfurtransferase